jgi:uncharacterized protein (DUF488 family)
VRSLDEADFFTVGYMRRDSETFVSVLLEAGIASVVDIRHSPVSMYRPEFSKSNLACLLESAGIEYLHVPDLGVPRDIRGRAFAGNTRRQIWSWYDAHVIPRFVGKNLHHLLNLADHPLALLCVELDPTACHRHRLALALESRGLKGYDL